MRAVAAALAGALAGYVIGVRRVSSPKARGGCKKHQKNSADAAVPVPPPTARVEIEYCVGCRWLLRAAWASQELLTTFQGQLKSVTLVPNAAKPGGVFEVRVDSRVVFSRKAEGRFPEMKELKQLVRDRVAPEKALGHSDKPCRA